MSDENLKNFSDKVNGNLFFDYNLKKNKLV